MEYRLQRRRQEMIEELQEIMVVQLKHYKKLNNNQLPRKILYYRDGVSEGQFTAVSIILLCIFAFIVPLSFRCNINFL